MNPGIPLSFFFCLAVTAGNLSPFSYPGIVTLHGKAGSAVISVPLGRLISFRVGEWDPVRRSLLPTPETRKRGEKEFVTYGGCRLWPHASGPKMLPVLGRQWPPDAAFDHSDWKLLERTQNSITVQSRISPVLGLQATRGFRLNESGTSVRISESVKRVRSGPLAAHIWTVTEILIPEKMIFAEHGKAGFQVSMDDVRTQFCGKKMILTPNGKLFHVISSGEWSAAVYPGWLLMQSHEKGFSSIVYGNPKEGYAELESKGPSVDLREGEELSAEIRLTILPLPGKYMISNLIEIIQNDIEKEQTL